MAQIHSCKICGIEPDDSRAFPSLSPPPSSVVDHLLDSNDSPTLQNKNLIQNYLLCIQERLGAIDEAIENLRRTRTDLERERAKYTGLISHIRSLPPEILSEIFLAYRESWWESVDASEPKDELEGWNLAERALNGQTPARNAADRIMTRMRPMRVVSWVSRGWRAVAHGCSALWSKIYLEGLGTNGDFSAAQRLLLDQLKLSSSRPLRINASIRDNDALWPRKYSSLLSRHVFPAHHRWMNVNISIRDDILLQLPKAGIAPNFPALISLHIDFRPPYGGATYHLSTADAPLLTEVDLTWDGTHGKDKGFQLPWAQLRKLRLVGYERDIAFSIIQRLQKVEELALIRLRDWEPIFQQGGIDLVLPFLRRLEISGVGCGASPGSLLPHFRLPALRALIWTQMNEDDLDFLNTMFRETWPDGYKLAELYLHTPYITSLLPQLFESIQSHAEVVEILYPNLTGMDLTDVMILLLQFLKVNSVPKLRAFKVQGALFEPWDLWELLPHLKTRDIDVRIMNSTFGDFHLYEPTYIPNLVSSLQIFSPIDIKGHLELDIEGPNSKRLTYSPQSGVRIEKSQIRPP